MSVVASTFMCASGQMHLSRSLHDALSEVFVAHARHANAHALEWGSGWFCPGCGVPMNSDTEHVRCPKCGELLDEFLRELVELHPHREPPPT